MLNWLKKHFHTKRLDEVALQELEEALIRGEVGVKTSEEIVAKLSKKYKNKDINIKAVLTELLEHILLDNVGKLELIHKPHVIMMVGAKGSGKTTSVCRLASLLHTQGKKVALIAGDTSCLTTVQQLYRLANKYKMRFFMGIRNVIRLSFVWMASKKQPSKKMMLLLLIHPAIRKINTT